ncbi:hypothetical protein GHT06_012137 [Daphnia sinensis]|uniref:Uncharacterized protein n=1 Tax=Daphnia sinensis TaxID=1820382 RepID=A0AAD5PVE4_9CRUS|nr:hypothetical protein GHT06_012137 [Daphnia sinensis]
MEEYNQELVDLRKTHFGREEKRLGGGRLAKRKINARVPQEPKRYETFVSPSIYISIDMRYYPDLEMECAVYKSV